MINAQAQAGTLAAYQNYSPERANQIKGIFFAPALRRFLQPDPIGYQGGLAPYVHVGNDPLNRVDPMGTKVEPAGGSGGNWSLTGGRLVVSIIISFMTRSLIITVSVSPLIHRKVWW